MLNGHFEQDREPSRGFVFLSDKSVKENLPNRVLGMSNKSTAREKTFKGIEDGGKPMSPLTVANKMRTKDTRSVVQELVREGVLGREERALYSAA